MTIKALDELQEILDRLGPNMWLSLDEVAIARYSERTFEHGLSILRVFAEANGCCAVNEGERSMKIGRAYYREASI
jgi:hypothetical protein